MNTKREMTFNILKGPNRNELLDGFLYAFDGVVGRKLCRFTLDDSTRTTVETVLVTLTHECGNGFNFNFEGYYYPKPSADAIECSGYYDAKTRKGWLKAMFN